MSHEIDPDRRFLRGLVVLYAEDDPDVRRQLVELLSRRVREVIPARDGAEALALFHARRPDLVITDIRMPSMDGLTLARAIHDVAKSTPILVTTAFDQTEYLVSAIEIGIEHYVMKPVEWRLFDERLLACARRLRLEAETEQKRTMEAEMIRAGSVRLLAGGMAHDYNNLLQAILGNVALAREMSAPGTPVFEMLADAENAALEAKDLSAQLLALADRRVVGQGPTEVVPVVRAALDEVLSDGNVTVTILAPETCPKAHIAPETLLAVVRQLGTNAREAMPSGGALRVHVRLAAPEDTAPGDEARLQIAFTDSGHGISKEDLPRVFDPYFTTKPRGQQRGTGLGLSVVRALLQRYDGRISVTSSPGEGSTFELSLPVVTGAD